MLIKPPTLLLVTVFSLHQLWFIGKPRNKLLCNVLLLMQNAEAWLSLFVNCNGYLISDRILVFFLLSLFLFGVTTKQLFTLQSILYFMNVPNIWRLIITWFEINLSKNLFYLNTFLPSFRSQTYSQKLYSLLVFFFFFVQVGLVWFSPSTNFHRRGRGTKS